MNAIILHPDSHVKIYKHLVLDSICVDLDLQKYILSPFYLELETSFVRILGYPIATLDVHTLGVFSFQCYL